MNRGKILQVHPEDPTDTPGSQGTVGEKSSTI
jgi:hypothetical protein